jgi:hypothetical protein
VQLRYAIGRAICRRAFQPPRRTSRCQLTKSAFPLYAYRNPLSGNCNRSPSTKIRPSTHSSTRRPRANWADEPQGRHELEAADPRVDTVRQVWGKTPALGASNRDQTVALRSSQLYRWVERGCAAARVPNEGLETGQRYSHNLTEAEKPRPQHYPARILPATGRTPAWDRSLERRTPRSSGPLR